MRLVTLPITVLLFVCNAALTVPAWGQITWDGGGDGVSWTDPDNWNPNGVPTATDDVELSALATDVTLSTTETVAALTVESSATLTVTASGALTIDGLFTWSSGTVDGTGTVTASGGALFDNTTKTLGANLVLASDADWTRGTIRMEDGATLTNQGGHTLTVAVEFNESVTRLGTITTEPVFANAGTVVRDPQDQNSSGTISNETASIDVVFDNTGGVDVQSGTLELGSGGTSSGSFTTAGGSILRFQVTGTSPGHQLTGASVTGAGEIDFEPGGSGTVVTFSGAYTYNITGTTRHSSSGTTTFHSSGFVPNTGNVIIENGTLRYQLFNPLFVEAFTQTSGTFETDGDVTINGLFTWGFGTITGTGTITADGGSLFENTTKTLGTDLVLASATEWAGGFIRMEDGTILTNQAGQTLTIGVEFGERILRFGSIATEPVFANAGTVVRDPQDQNGTGTVSNERASIDVVFDNSGTVDVQSGTLELGFGGISAGNFATAASSVLRFQASTSSPAHQLTGASISGAGQVDFQPSSGGAITLSGSYGYNVTGTTRYSSVGTTTFQSGGTITNIGSVIIDNGTWRYEAAALTIPNYTQTLGTFETQADVTVTGAAVFNGGQIDGLSGTPGDHVMLVQGGATFGEFGTFTVQNGLSLDLASDASWTDGNIRMGDAARITVQSGQTLTVSHELDHSITRTGTITTEPVFDVNGTFVKDVQDLDTDGDEESGETRIDVVFENAGVVQIIDDAEGDDVDELDLRFGGTSSGSFDVPEGTLLRLRPTTSTPPFLLTDASIAGTGEVDFEPVGGSAAVTFSGAYTYNITGTTRHSSSGITTFENGGTVTSIGDLFAQSGSLVFESGAAIASVGPVQITSGTWRYEDATAVAVASYTQTGGAFETQADLTITGPAVFDGGQIDGLSATAGDQTVLVQDGATFGGFSTFSIQGGVVLDLASNATWNNGSIGIGNAAEIVVQSGQTFTVAHEVTRIISRDTSPAITTEPVFTLNGTFVKDVEDIDANGTEEGGDTRIGVVFNNAGTVQIIDDAEGDDIDALDLQFGGTSSGSFDVGASTFLRFRPITSSPPQLLPGASIAGDGEVDFQPAGSGVVVTLSGSYTYNVTGTTRHSNIGTTTFEGLGTVASIGDLFVESGTLLFKSGAAIASIGPVELASGTWRYEDGTALTIPSYAQTFGTFETQADATITGTAAFNAGTIDGLSSALGARTVLVQGGATFAGGGNLTLLNGVTIDLASSGTWNDGSIFMGDAAQITVQAGQTLAATHEFSHNISRTGTISTEPVVNVNGTFIKDVTDVDGDGNEEGGGTRIAVVFDNAGTVQLVDDDEGDDLDELEIQFGGTSSGRFDVAAGTLLRFRPSSGTLPQLLPGTSIAGAGEVDFRPSGGSTAVTLSGPYTYNVTGTTRHSSSGTTTFEGLGTVASIGDLFVESGTLLFESGAAIASIGPVALTSGTWRYEDGTALIIPSYAQTFGTFETQADATITGTATFNAGTVDGLSSTPGARTLLLQGGATFGGSSTLTVRNGVTLDLASNATWPDHDIALGDATQLVIQSGQTFTASHEGTESVFRTGTINTFPRITINGTFVKDVADIDGNSTEDGGRSRIDVLFDNAGVVQIVDDAESNDIDDLELSFGGTNTGSYTVADGTHLTLDAASGQTHTNAGGGLIQGTGLVDVDPDFVNNGTFAPGASAGQLTYEGSYDQTAPTATLDIELGGTTPGTEFDQLAVTSGGFGALGEASLGGVLNVSTLNSFVPNDGDAFVILTAPDGVNGTFDTLNGLDLGNGVTLDVQYNPDNVTLVANQSNTADLQVTKTPDNATPDLGATVNFTVTLENLGPANATSVTVTDVLSSGLDLVPGSSSATAGSFDESTGVWTIGTLANAADATLTLAATATQGGAQSNTVTAQAGQSDPDNTNNTAVADVDVQSADLRVTKTVDDSGPNVGDLVTYTVTLTNAGPTDATGVQVTDQLPPEVSFQAARPSDGTFDNDTGLWNVGALSAATGSNTATLELDATIDQPGQITNTATISASDQPDPVPGNNTATRTLTAQQSNLRILKTVDNATPLPNDPVVFTVTLTNLGPSTATGITVNDPVPTGLTFENVTASAGTWTATDSEWTVPSLAAGSANSVTLTIEATVVATSGSVTNTATITALDQTDPAPGNNTASATVTIQAADLAVTKTVDNGTPNVNDDVTFTVTLTNNGPSEATGVEVTDQLPSDLTFVSANTSQGSYSSGTGLWNVGAVTNGANATLDLVATVDQAGLITNTASVTASDQPDVTPGNNSASASVNGLQADLAVTKIVDNATPNLGENVTFTVTLTNNGPSDATGVEVTDQLPAGLTLVSADASQGSYTSDTGLWTVGALANAGQATLAITATVDQTGVITNTASVTASDVPDLNTGNNSASASVGAQSADLEVTKTVDIPTPDVGDTVTFTVTLANNGPSGATGVEVTDQLPAGLTLVSADASQGSYTSDTGLWTVGALANAGQATLAITATVDQTGPLTNVASVTNSDQADPNSGNNSDDVTVGGQAADLAVTKTVDNATPNLGDSVTFTVTLTNNGPSDATGVVVTDLLPTELTFVSATPSPGTYDDGTGLWNIGPLANAAQATLTISATVDQAGPITNVASITASDQPDLDDGNNSDDATVEGQAADLALTKTVDNATPPPNGPVIFTVTLSNLGPTAATGITVSDPVPTGLTFDNVTASAGTWNGTDSEWSVPSLAAGSANNVTLTIEATVVATSGSVTNTATITALDQIDPAAGNNSASTTLTVTVTNTPPTANDDTATTQEGTAVDIDVLANDTDPDPGQTLSIFDIRTAPSDGTAVINSGVITYVPDSGFTGTDSFEYTVSDGAGGTDDAEVTITVNPQPTADLEVDKTVDNATPNVGENVTFTVTLTNNGPSDASGVEVTDQLPPEVTFQAARPSGATTYDETTGIWDVGPLNAASGSNTATLELDVTIDQPGQITNIAEITASDQPDPVPDNNTARASVTGVVADTTPPVCADIDLEFNGPNGAISAVNTGASDPESGIASATFTTLRNLIGSVSGNGPFSEGDVQPFDPASTPSITIRGERISFSKGGAIVVTVENGAGLTADCDPVVEQIGPTVPTGFALHGNYPNPVRGGTTIAFELPEPGAVRLEVFDLLGRKVATLVDGPMAPGIYEVQWPESETARLNSGTYVYRLQAGRFRASKRLAIVK